MNDCTVTGSITAIEPDYVTINIQPDSACSSCGGGAFCGSGKEREIKIPSGELASDFEPVIGDAVTVRIQSGVLLRTVFILYLGGILAAAAISGVAYYFAGVGETAAAVIFLVLSLLAVPFTGKILNKGIKNKVHWRVTKSL